MYSSILNSAIAQRCQLTVSTSNDWNQIDTFTSVSRFGWRSLLGGQYETSKNGGQRCCFGQHRSRFLPAMDSVQLYRAINSSITSALPPFQLSTQSPNTRCRMRIPTTGTQSTMAETTDCFNGAGSDGIIMSTAERDIEQEQESTFK